MSGERQQVAAYRTAIGLMLGGFVFALFSIEFAGIDILLDAVGWILVFNGVRPIEKPQGGVGPRALLCLLLVAVSGVQMFTLGTVGAVITVLRALAEAGLFVLLVAPLRKLLLDFGQARAGATLAGVFWLNALVSLAAPLLLLPAPAGMAAVYGVVALCAHILLLAVLVWLLAQMKEIKR